jgi:hypothetical protein
MSGCDAQIDRRRASLTFSRPRLKALIEKWPTSAQVMRYLFENLLGIDVPVGLPTSMTKSTAAGLVWSFYKANLPALFGFKSLMWLPGGTPRHRDATNREAMAGRTDGTLPHLPSRGARTAGTG